MGRLLEFMGRHGTRLLFAGVFVGLALPGLAALCRPLLAPSVIALLAAALLRIDLDMVRRYGRRPLLTAALVAWLLLLSPLLAFALVQGLPAPLAAGVVLMAAAPPIMAAPGLAAMLGLDGALAAVAGLASTLLAPLTLPPLALALLGVGLEIGVADFMFRLAAVIGLAVAAAAAIRGAAGPARLAARARQIDGVFVAFMLVFAVAIMDGVSEALFARPGTVALWAAAAFVANPLLQALGAAAFVRLGRRGALTVGLLSGNCNFGLLLAALPADTDFDVRLFFALAQLPMYMLPALLLPLYRRLLAGAPR